MKTKKNVLFALISKEGKVLLQHKTDDYAFHPNGWAIFGGAIEKGETPEQAAHREAKEELGIELTELKFVKQFDFVEANQQNLQFFVFQTPLRHSVEQLKRQLTEGAGLALFNEKEIETLDLLRRHREMLKEIFKQVARVK